MRKIYIGKPRTESQYSINEQNTVWDISWTTDTADISLERIQREEYFEKLFYLLRTYQPKSILEAGCGRGQWIKGFKELGISISGTDLSQEALYITKQNCSTAILFRSDLRNIPIKSNSYDFIISLGVIEHFAEGIKPILLEHYRILKPHGIMFAHIPFQNLNRRFNVFWRASTCIKQNSLLRHFLKRTPPIFFEWMLTKKEILNLFKACGFSIQEHRPIYTGGGFIYDLPSFLKTGIFQHVTDKFANYIDKNKTLFGPIFSHHYLVVSQKA